MRGAEHDCRDVRMRAQSHARGADADSGMRINQSLRLAPDTRDLPACFGFTNPRGVKFGTDRRERRGIDRKATDCCNEFINPLTADASRP